MGNAHFKGRETWHKRQGMGDGLYSLDERDYARSLPLVMSRPRTSNICFKKIISMIDDWGIFAL